MLENEYTRRIAYRHIGQENFQNLAADLQARILEAIDHAYRDGYEDGANSEDEDE